MQKEPGCPLLPATARPLLALSFLSTIRTSQSPEVASESASSPNAGYGVFVLVFFVATGVRFELGVATRRASRGVRFRWRSGAFGI